jgi:hypothetical protein
MSLYVNECFLRNSPHFSLLENRKTAVAFRVEGDFDLAPLGHTASELFKRRGHVFFGRDVAAKVIQGVANLTNDGPQITTETAKVLSNWLVSAVSVGDAVNFKGQVCQ